QLIADSCASGQPIVWSCRLSPRMKHTTLLAAACAALLMTVPTVVYGWQDGRVDAYRMRAEIRREWHDAMRETHRTMEQARREIRRAGSDQRRAVRDATRDVVRAARQVAREARGEAREIRRRFRDW